MWDNISQIAILLLGPLAIWLVAKKNKWGFVAGLISQPFWLLTSFLNHQWGVFIVTVFYTYSWGLGVYEWFYQDKKSN